MEAMREAWTDDRLDDLNGKVANGFRRVDARFDRVDDKFDSLEARIDARFDSLQRTMILASSGVIVALIGLVATQL
jgi:hypothetical protein